MHITKIHVEGFKRLVKLDLKLNDKVNVIVGDNETGKSSILEAITLVLSRQYDGRNIDYGIDPYLFNSKVVADYFAERRRGGNSESPRILIEVYFDESYSDPNLAKLKGVNNTKNENCPGLVLTIEVHKDHVDSLKEYAADESNPVVMPVEFYHVTWRSFANNSVTIRNLPVKAATIDTSLARVYRGPNSYVSQVVNDVLTQGQRRDLSLAYKKMRHGFSQEPGVTAINDHLEQRGNPATKKKLTVQMDMSSRSSWDRAVTAHLDDLPFDCAGKGEQCRVQIRLAIASEEQSRVLLIEEPENHLSHSNLNMLMNDICNDCADQQVILTTHSAFVLNKLGIDNLVLISHSGQTAMLSGLDPETKDYFMKLPGYDTLRLLLSKRSILVEGPSDELIVQRAYKDKHGKMPIENGVDVISVGSLAFKRFLEIARLLKLDVRVVTDNDGDVTALETKYKDYLQAIDSTIRICYDPDTSYGTLEPQLLKANSLDTLKAILGTKHKTDDALLTHMSNNKTDCALKMFKTDQPWATPEYIAHAIK